MRVRQVLRMIAISGFCLVLFTLRTEAETKVTSQPFGKMPDGTALEIFTLSDGPYEARITNYGGVVVSLKAPDRNGKSADVVLGFDDLNGYVANFNSPSTAFSEQSSAAMAIAFPTAALRWMARIILCRSITAKTPFTAGHTALTMWCGRPGPSQTAWS